MKSFRTDLIVKPSVHKIGLKSPVLTIGSCFADAIGMRLRRNKFPALVNPFGTLYNPLSIHKALQYTLLREAPPDHTYLVNNSLALNYDFHSSFSGPEKDGLSSQLQDLIGSSHSFLKDTEWILITYGTAWVYSRKDTGEVVANCHKMPASGFTKSLLTENTIVESFKTFHDLLIKLNPQIRIILTLSPVRHIKDTLELNSVSKAVVRVACHRLTEAFANVEYFPAYEIMMDDLRDYRFYKSDMLHPTEEAEEYIWEKFSERYFNDDTHTFLKQWKTIQSALAHRPFHETSPSHQQFLRDTLKKLDDLKTHVDISEEAALLKNQLR